MQDKRDMLLNAFKNYKTSYDEEEYMLKKMIAFVEANNNCFERSNQAGHITGSALLVSPDNQKVLLTHHKILDKWLQFGGHSDGNPDSWSVALRETIEESGITEVEFVTHDIFDIDIHSIPENIKKGEPEHFHYDVRFLIRTKTEEFVISNESTELKWFTFDELKVAGIITSNSLSRLFDKWQNYKF